MNEGNVQLKNFGNEFVPPNQRVLPPPPPPQENVKIATFRSELRRLKELLSNPNFLSLVESISKDNIDDEEVEHDDELIHSSNKTLNKINEHIHKLNLLLIRIYRKKFPGLDEQIKDPVLYAKVCQRIGNSTNIDQVRFQDLLPPKSILVLRMTFSDILSRLNPGSEINSLSRTSQQGGEIAKLVNSRQLHEDEMELVKEVISSVLEYESFKNRILTFVSSQMKFVAPNLSAIVGTILAAQLVGIAGGLEALSRLDSSSIQMLGKSNERYQYLHGFSASSIKNRFSGIVGNCDIVQMTPSAYQKRASKMISNKCVMSIRCDQFRTSPDGSVGRKLREKVIYALTKIQAPPPPIQEKPLPIPDSGKKGKKRGGRNARRLKRLYGMTEVRSKMNRVAFGEQQIEDFGTGESFGLLGAQTGDNTLKLRPKTKIKIKKQLKGDQTAISQSTPYYGGGKGSNPSLSSATNSSSNFASGMASSLVFTPVQGLSLTNPEFNRSRKRKRNKFFEDLEFKRPEKKRKRD